MLRFGSMDPFVRRLVERLIDPAAPLSRNRHFHTFDTPEGKLAMKTSRRLKSLQRDILACSAQGSPAQVAQVPDATGGFRVELHFAQVKGRRVSVLRDAEFELLRRMPGVEAALAPPSGP